MRAECSIAYLRWVRDSTGDLEDAEVDVVVGATLDAEFQWNLHQMRVTIEQRLPTG